MARCRSLTLVVLFGAAVSFGCASSPPAQATSVSPVAKAAPPSTKAVAAKSKPAPRTAASSKAKPVTKAQAKPSAKAGAKPRNVAVKPGKPAPRTVAAAAPKAKAHVKAKPRAERSGPSGMVLSLGAGDSLGKAVYINDVIIAARAAKGKTEFAEVQPKDSDN